MKVPSKGTKVAGPLVRRQLPQLIRERLVNSPAEASGSRYNPRNLFNRHWDD